MVVDQSSMNHFERSRKSCSHWVCVLCWLSTCVCCDTLLWPWTQIRQNAAWVFLGFFFFHQQHMGHLFQMHLPFNSVTGAAPQFLPQPLREKLYIFLRAGAAFIPLCMTSLQSSAGPWALKFVSTVQSKMSYVKNYRSYVYTLFSSNISIDSIQLIPLVLKGLQQANESVSPFVPSHITRLAITYVWK